MEGVELVFTPEALRCIARQAIEKGTGARGLRTIMERMMTELMFEIPSRRNMLKKVVIDERVVERGRYFPLVEEEEKLA
jgi:ATP-dependent Clp protease ATP-binding subunit ClpX